MSELDKMKALCKGVRAISPGFEIKITASQVQLDHYCITVGTDHAIIIHTDFGMLDTVINLALSKLASISQKTLAAIKAPDDEK